jgi:hypothetical protein
LADAFQSRKSPKYKDHIFKNLPKTFKKAASIQKISPENPPFPRKNLTDIGPTVSYRGSDLAFID